MKQLIQELRPALLLFLILTFITGVAYPLAVTAVGLGLFPHQARGSLIERDGKTIGSELIAQPFTSDRYFWPRPSAANYNAAASSGSNLGPTNSALIEAVQSRMVALNGPQPIPADLVTTSASGLDPHLSLAAVGYQLPRVARARTLPEPDLRRLITDHTQPRTLGILGEPRVNVVTLNLALDAIATENP